MIFAGAFYFVFDLNPADSGTVVIKVNGKIYAEIALNQEKDVEIYLGDGTLSNIVRIKDNKVVMIFADCPDKRCMHQTNGFIVCLPNRVTVEIINRKKHEFDIII